MSYSKLTLFVALILTAGACTKKESAKPVVKPTTITDSAHVSNAVSFYPHIDTFTGVMAVSLHQYAYIIFDSTNNHFTFYMTYLDEHTVVYTSGGNIWLQQGSAISINDTFTINPAITDSGNMYVYDWEKKGNDVYPRSIVFKKDRNTLTVSWDISDMPMIGTCDWAESTGNFTGTIK